MKLFVGNLSWNTTQDDLRRKFSTFGEINELRLIEDRETGRSRGFAFVTFEEESDANEAMEAMNGQNFDGREIKVNPANEKPKNQRRQSQW